MRLYEYSPLTGANVGRYMDLPDIYTTEPPPLVEPGHVAVWQAGRWRVFEDHRGEDWYEREGGRQVIIDAIGPVSESLVRDVPPAAERNRWRRYVDGAWTTVQDHRGEVYMDPVGQTVMIQDFGPLPPDLLPVPPMAVSRMGLRIAMRQMGLLEDVDAAVAASGDPSLEIAWADAATFSREDPRVLMMMVTLGKSRADLYALFRAAGSL